MEWVPASNFDFEKLFNIIKKNDSICNATTESPFQLRFATIGYSWMAFHLNLENSKLIFRDDGDV